MIARTFIRNTAPLCLALSGLLLSAALAATRTSINYSITTEIDDAGGRRVVSANYVVDASAGGEGIGATIAAADSSNSIRVDTRNTTGGQGNLDTAFCITVY